jgi:hypothetical protein
MLCPADKILVLKPGASYIYAASCFEVFKIAKASLSLGVIQCFVIYPQNYISLIKKYTKVKYHNIFGRTNIWARQY